MPEAPLPEGSLGLPLVGNTLSFLSDMFGFIHRGAVAHGRLFRARILGADAIFLSGPSACEAWIDESRVTRGGSFPKPVLALFGGRSVPMLDGEEHKTRKRLLLEAFTLEAREGYLPILERLTQAAFERWSSQGELAWLPEIKRLVFEGMAATIFGLAPGPEVDRLREDYARLLAGFSALPLSLPFTTFGQAVAARDRILSFFAQTIAKKRAGPSASDGLSRLLRARSPAGETLGDAALALELHHIVIAGFIVYAELAWMVTALAAHPSVRERLASELGGTSGPQTLATLQGLPYLNQLVMEVKRTCPNVAVSFGRASSTFEVEGRRVPKGIQLFMAVGENNRISFDEPDAFDPDRFGAGREEQKRHPHAFVPQGPGPADGHRCLGIDFTTDFMQLFAVALVRDHRFALPAQDLSLLWKIVPPEPKSGLRAKIDRV